MAIFLRRAFSFRNLLLHRSSAILGRELLGCNSERPQRILSLPALEFVKESRRGFAKGQDDKSKDEQSAIEILPNMGPTIKANATSLMEAAITALSAELTKLRTGRAYPGMLDHIIVETGGVKLPLSQIAVVSVRDSKTLSINPFDPNFVSRIFTFGYKHEDASATFKEDMEIFRALQKLETAIVESALGLNPKVEGEQLIAAIPPLTKEHVQAIYKVVAKTCEDGRQSIRRARQKAMDTIKKLYSKYPKDDLKRWEKEVDELTKKFVKTAEDLCKAKEKEIGAG